MNNPLFSIAVVCYNQQDLVQQTLDSIRNQTYQNIEIVVVDDFSTDDTYDRVLKFKQDNKDRFKITVKQNTKNEGISYTHDIALQLATGKYFKYIGGDDLLAPDAIEKAVKSFETDKDIDCFMCTVATFTNDIEIITGILPPSWEISFFDLNARDQFYKLIYKNDIIAPGMFFKREVLLSVGGFDTTFKKFEDYHTWIKLTWKGIKIHYCDELLVYWRRHASSISFSAWRKGDSDYKRNELLVLEKYVDPIASELSWIYRAHVSIKKRYLKCLIKTGVNRKNHRLLRKMFLFDPLWIKNLPDYYKIKKNRRMKLKNRICNK